MGGRAIFVRDGHVVLAEGDREEPIVSLARLPLTRGGQIAFPSGELAGLDCRRMVPRICPRI